MSSRHWGIGGNSHLISVLWPLLLLQTALDLNISPALFVVLWGTVHILTPDPCWPVGTSPTGLRPTKWGDSSKKLRPDSSLCKSVHNILLQCVMFIYWKMSERIAGHKHSKVDGLYMYSEMLKTECNRVLITIWTFGLWFHSVSTMADFTNWFPFILRGELITEISCCVEMDWKHADSCLGLT